MPAALLPTTSVPSEVFVNLFDYGDGTEEQNKYVLPLAGLLNRAAGAGSGLSGEVVLVADVATVPATAVTSTSRIFLSRRLVGVTAGNMGFTRNAGVGFSITNSSNTDTSTVEWFVIP